MIGIDTNVLVRFVTADDPEQSPVARRFMEGLHDNRPGYVGLVVLAELHWVLVRTYRYSQADSQAVIEFLADTEAVFLESADLVRAALGDAVRGTDFADALVARGAMLAGCRSTVTFDRRAARHAAFELLDT